MKQGYLKHVFLSVAALVCTVCLILGIVFIAPTHVKAETKGFENEEIKAVYVYDSEQTFPTSITVEDNKIAKDATLEYPSGKLYPIKENSNKFTLNEYGAYRLRYYLNVDGVLTTYAKTFTVNESYFNLSAENGSTIEAKNFKKDEEGNYVVDDGLIIEKEADTFTGKEGLNVTLREGCEFVYNEPIDLSKTHESKIWDGSTINVSDIIDLQGVLGYIVDYKGDVVKESTTSGWRTYLQYWCDTCKKGLANGNEYVKKEDGKVLCVECGSPVINNWTYVPKAEYMVITLTDVYDSSNSVSIHWWATNGQQDYRRGHSLLFAGSSTQQPWGVEFGKETNNGEWRPLLIDGKNSSACLIGWNHGCEIKHYTQTSVMSAYKEWQSVNLQYDYERNRIYYTVDYKTRKNGLITDDVEDTTSYICADLESTVIYGDNVFKGFTTGEVYLSIKMTDYESEAANFELYGINGRDTNFLFEQYNSTTDNLKDEVAPKIEINAEPTIVDSETGIGKVYGAVGSNFTIPTATAYDANLKGDVKASVYLNYNHDPECEDPYKEAYQQPIKNGAFKISSPDIYTIVYTAEDQSGLVSTKTLDVIAIANDFGTGIYIDWDNKSEFDSWLKNGVTTGKSNAIPGFNLVSINKQDSLKLRVYAQNDFETVEIDTHALTFMPKYPGEYNLIFEYSDNVYSYVRKEKLTATLDSTVVSFLDEPLSYRYYIKDAAYGINELNAYTFGNNGPTQQRTDVYVKFDGGQPQLITNLDKVEITGNETVQFIYKFEKDGLVAVKETEVAKIVDVGYAADSLPSQKIGEDGSVTESGYFMYKYFTGDDFTSNPFSGKNGAIVSDIVYTAKAKTGNAKLEFANPISYENFKFVYITLTDTTNFKTLRLTLTSIVDKTSKIVIDIYEADNKCFAKINDASPIELKNFKLATNNSATISYEEAGRKLLIGASNAINIDFDLASSLVDFDVEFLDLYGKSEIKIRTLNNQALSNNRTGDTVSPEILAKSAQGKYDVNTIVDFYAPCAYDVLSPIVNSKYTLQVEAPDGTYVTATDGTVLSANNSNPNKDYSIELTQAGRYKITWSCTDYAGKNKLLVHYIDCIDHTPPTISFADGRDENTTVIIELGEKLKLDYTVEDDSTPSENIVVYVNAVLLRTSMIEVFKDDEITLRTHGDWEIIITAYDANWNMAQKSFICRVVEG